MSISTPRHPALMLLLLACAQLIIALDYTIVFVALPTIGEHLAIGPRQLQWIISAFGVAFGGCLLLGGRAADLLGRRRLYRLGQALFAIASLAGGLTDQAEILVLARALQGLAGALLFPATLALINSQYAEGAPRTRALAIWSAASAAGLALGALLGGILTQWLGWQAVFLVNVPLAGACAWAAGYWIPADPVRAQGRSFDLAGALTITLGGSLLVLALIEGPSWGWQRPLFWTVLAAALICLALFGVIETRSRDPLMPLRLLRTPGLRAAMGLTAVFMASFSVQYYFLALYFQQIYGYSVLASGLAFLPATLVCTLGIGIAERALAGLGLRSTLIIGLLAGGVGILWLGWSLPGDGVFVHLLAPIALLSIGQGMTWTAMWVCAGQGVAAGEQGVASGMASTVQQIGGALGLALLVGLANQGLDGLSGAAWQQGYALGLQRAVLVSGGIALLGVLIALVLPGKRRSTAAVAETSAGSPP
ncbi:Multidrug resistance protein Stp [Pseudomonas fluorescens]|uniref:Multidrug resistance protein Stp n=2 Tax=Pseudomonas TaxID=286 RepID=A0A5E6T4S2_PSEFL|nr:Multidrug resistance protein Stp [Pseudomonas fluorescens]